jgi:predicted O-methyltransferase YrrM
VDPRLLEAARSVKGFMPDDEGLALYRAARLAADAVAGPLLEIGTYCGKSSVYLGAAAQEAKTVLFSIDHHRGSEEIQPGWEHHDPAVVDLHSGRIDTLPWARQAIAQAGLEDVVVLVVGSSATIALHWSTPLSMLFIDGGHGADVAWADYRGWVPKVAPMGILAIHDVFADPSRGGQLPYDLYRQALGSGFEELPDAGGGSLRVLRRVSASSV